MDTINAGQSAELWIALAAEGRSPEIPESEDLYGRLIGSWALDVRHYYGLDVTSQSLEGEAHFGWVLEGRAVQDVFIVSQNSGQSGDSGKVITYGSTLRVWDPTIQAWRITWTNPARNHREEQIAVERRGYRSDRSSFQRHGDSLDVH